NYEFASTPFTRFGIRSFVATRWTWGLSDGELTFYRGQTMEFSQDPAPKTTYSKSRRTTQQPVGAIPPPEAGKGVSLHAADWRLAGPAQWLGRVGFRLPVFKTKNYVPEWQSPRPTISIEIPLLLPLAIFLVPTIVLWRRHRRRPP